MNILITLFKSKKIQTLILLCLPLFSFAQKTIRYDLFISDTIVNYTGKKVKAFAINGQIPAPTLYFTEGDTAEIHVHNQMHHHETSIHWHGLILPNEQDGVPYLTTAPIKAMQTHIFRFPIVQKGTYWYHSHTMLQEQSGMYGAFIIRKRNEPPMPEYVMLLSDWTNENPHQIQRSLHNATDWYAIKKGSTQNYGEALQKGYLGTKLENEWKRMTPMDVADVYYNQFWVNGKVIQKQTQFKAGDKVRVRIINGGSSSYFWLQYAGGKITVVANDGIDTESVEVDRMIIAVAETYDIILTIPEDMSYELKATPEDRTQFASLFLGNGMEMKVPEMPKLKYFEGMKMMNGMMKLNGKMEMDGMEMSLQQMDMNTVMYPEITGEDGKSKKMKGMEGMNHENHQQSGNIITLNYGMLRSPIKTNLPDAPTRTLKFELTGNMNRYVWTIDQKTVSETDKILIKQGENIKIIITNNSMMRHPMHLHGHFFRVLNGQGDYAPLKNVLDIMPMETDTIEFHASEKYGDWFFHCHILYHMMVGMGRIFTYENSPSNPQLPNPQKALRKVYADDRRFYSKAEIGLESNGSDGEAQLSNTRYLLQTEWRIGLNNITGYEIESHFGRYLGRNQFFMPYIGWDIRYRTGNEIEKNIFNQEDTKNNRQVFCAGFQYTLPLFVIADARIDQTGNFRFQLRREDIAITNRVRFNFMVNTDKEYQIGARYIMTKYLAFSSHYDSDMKWGGGLTFIY
jgi:FtsP/CotA-like multicopper oxidase with cupredoxin domain